MSEEFMSFIPADQNIVPDVKENNTLENDTLENEQSQEETTETDETNELENNEIDNDEIEIDQSQINPLLYFDAPITRPNKAAQRELNEVSERALTGRRPSMREPRKPKPQPDFSPRNSISDYGQNVTDYNEPQLNYEPEDKDFQRKKQLEIEETKRQVENYFGRSEKKEPEIQITGLELKEDIQITLDQNAIKSLIILGLNQRYKKEGLRVNPEIDEEVKFEANKVNEKQKSYSGYTIKAEVTMQRIPTVRFIEE